VDLEVDLDGMEVLFQDLGSILTQNSVKKNGRLMKKIIVGLIVAAVAGYGVLSYHFVLLDSSLKILKKTGVRYENTFVDARGNKKFNLALKPDLIAAGINDVLRQAEGSVEKHSDQ
jgi:uncharacterized membrane protein YobD (UPF0266 family)